jgi:hypothetical protein
LAPDAALALRPPLAPVALVALVAATCVAEAFTPAFDRLERPPPLLPVVIPVDVLALLVCPTG